jgi:hypothetical protein
MVKTGGATVPAVVSSLLMVRVVSGTLRTLRIFAVIVAIVSMLSVSAASVSAAHTHLKEPVDQCNVCHTAHMTVRQVAVIQIVHALELESVLSLPVTGRFPESPGISSRLTRGPPVSL